MPQCNECDAHISKDYWRVWADNDGRVNGCLECSTVRERTNDVMDAGIGLNV